MILEIKGTEDRLISLIEELEEEGVKINYDNRGVKNVTIKHLTYWGNELDSYNHEDEFVTLNANLPSHRKHFKRRVLEHFNRN